MDIIKFSKELEDLIASQSELKEIATVLKDEYAITKSEELQRAIHQITDEGKMLKIGIIGRVKAGKSSLLNAMFFEGEEVLPKAATPMTAALTILEYGDKPKAIIDFFSKGDIEDIKTEHDEYLRQTEDITEQKLKELKERKRRKNSRNKPTESAQIADSEDIKDKARKQAEREVKKNEKLFSSYDQYERIKKSGISIEEVQNINSITADNNKELNEKLRDFVSSDGKFMPFTKSVTLQLNEKSLKDIQIIDTPGVNDPVTSREERTKELLKYCDAIFIISPSGQFFSSEDIDLLDRISQKEGIDEIHIIASKIDSQLFSSIKEEAEGVLHTALEKVTNDLKRHVKNTIDADQTLQQIKSLTQSTITCTSGMAYALLKKIDQKEQWDEDEKHLWNLLCEHYKDYFADEQTTETNLTLLANTTTLHAQLENIKEHKKTIMRKKRENFIKAKSHNFTLYKTQLIQYIKEKIRTVQESDLEEVTARKKELERLIHHASAALDDRLNDLIEILRLSLRKELTNKIDIYFDRAGKNMENSKGEYTDTWESGFLIWKETHTETIITIRAGHARNELEKITHKLEDLIRIDAYEKILKWKKELLQTVVSLLRKKAGDEQLDPVLINHSVKKVLSTIPYPEISYSGTFPKDLKKSGTLEGYRAEAFIENAENYLSDLRERVRNDTEKFTEEISTVLKSVNLSQEIFKSYRQEIETLEKDINNKELILDKYNRTLHKLNSIGSASADISKEEALCDTTM